MAIDEPAPLGVLNPVPAHRRPINLRGMRLVDLRGHVNMTLDETAPFEEDGPGETLLRILEAAVAHVGSDLGFAIDDPLEFPEGTPHDVRHAVLMLAAHWFSQREATVVGVSMSSVPFGYAEVIANHRAWVFG